MSLIENPKCRERAEVLHNDFINNAMSPVADRIQKELKLEIANEERMKVIFSADVLNSRGALLKKLERLDDIYARYKGTPRADEQMTLQLLLIKKKGLERILYPNWASRQLRSLWSRFKSEKKLKTVAKSDSETVNRLTEQAKVMEFSIDGKAIEKQMSVAADQFQVSQSFYKNDVDRIEYNLMFAKNENGVFQLEKYTAALTNEQSGESRKQQFSVTNEPVTALKAYNLLSGRSVQQEINDGQGNIQKTWIKLDLNDKDAEGNHKVKRFLNDFGFDLEKSLDALKIKESRMQESKEQLMTALKNGEKKEVVINVAGKDKAVFIEVNAQMRTFNLYDKDNAKLRRADGSDIKVGKSVELKKEPEQVAKRKTGFSVR